MALTVNNFTGFETQGEEEASASSGTPVYNTTSQRSGASALQFNANTGTWDLPWVSTGVTDAGADYIFGFVFSHTTGLFGLFCNILDDSGNTILSLNDGGSNTVELRDAEDNVLDTSGTVTAGLHSIEVYAALNSGSAAWEWFIDGVSEGSGSGADLTDGAAFGSSSSSLQFVGPSSGSYLFDDAYILSGATAASDRLGGSSLASMPEVFSYQNDQADTNSDAGLVSVGTSGGDSPAENWDRCGETPLDNSTDTSFTASGGVGGAVDLTGPSGDGNIDGDSNIIAIKGIWNLSRGNGGGSTHFIGLGDSGDTDVADATVSLSTSFANFFELRETNLPTSSQFITQGFGTSGNRDINCGDMWAQLLHVPDAAFTPDLNAYRFYDDDGGEAASTALAAQDININVDTDGGNIDVQLRLRVDETGGTGGVSTDDYQLQFDKNTGGFINVTGATSNIQGTTAGLTNDNATTNRASEPISDPGGSFVAGEQSSDGLVDNMELTADNFTEHAYGIRVVSADVVNGDTFDFQLSTPTGVVNSVVPRITIVIAGAATYPGWYQSRGGFW